MDGLEDLIVQLFPRVPQLARTGFMFAKATKMRQLVILNVTTVEHLRDTIGKGQLFIMPKRDILPCVALSVSVSVPTLLKGSLYSSYLIENFF